MKKLRSCAYCGLPNYKPIGSNGQRCECKYRAGRMGSTWYTCSNISRETTIAEFVESVNDLTKNFEPNTKVVFSFSFTELNKDMIAKADGKRQTAKVAARLLRKEDK